jgi:hypothetical protein
LYTKLPNTLVVKCIFSNLMKAANRAQMPCLYTVTIALNDDGKDSGYTVYSTCCIQCTVYSIPCG